MIVVRTSDVPHCPGLTGTGSAKSSWEFSGLAENPGLSGSLCMIETFEESATQPGLDAGQVLGDGECCRPGLPLCRPTCRPGGGHGNTLPWEAASRVRVGLSSYPWSYNFWKAFLHLAHSYSLVKHQYRCRFLQEVFVSWYSHTPGSSCHKSQLY